MQKTLDYQGATQFSKLPRVTSTLSRPTTTATTTWDVGDMTTGAGLQVDINNKTVRDLNHNLPVHMDQFGNVVQVQAVVNPTSGAQDMIQHTTEPLFTQQQQKVPQTASMDLLKANPLIQRLVEERVSMLEAQIKMELSQGNPNNRKKSGRYNTTDTPCAPPYRRWPNETCPSGATRKRTVFDDLSLGQFVVGLVSNILETQNANMRRHMLTELLETAKLTESMSWPIARGAFAVAMHHVEDENTMWADTRFLSEKPANIFTDSSIQRLHHSLT